MPQLIGPMIQLKWIRTANELRIHGNDLIICDVWTHRTNFLIRIISHLMFDGEKFYRLVFVHHHTLIRMAWNSC